MQLLFHTPISTANEINHRLCYGMAYWSNSILYIDMITYPLPRLNIGFADLCC